MQWTSLSSAASPAWLTDRTYPSSTSTSRTRATGDNLERLADVLRALDVKLTKAPPELPFQIDARTLENGGNFTFDTPLGRFDILGSIEGIRG